MNRDSPAMESSPQQTEALPSEPSVEGVYNEHSARETYETPSPHAQEPAANSDARVEDWRELLQQLAQSAKAQDAKLEALRIWLERYVAGAFGKDEAIVRMQKRLDEYERGMLRALKEPLLRDLILFYDSLDKLRRKCEQGVLPLAEAPRELELLRAELLEIFATQNLEPLALVDAPYYQAEQQKVVRVENAEGAEEHHRVTRVVREGFVWEGRILRKQEVTVKKWTEPTGA